jgi:tetratricopeptide (TPR) repeat protein
MYAQYGMPIKARRFYETAIEKGDTRAVVYFGLGMSLDQKNEFDKAEECFKKAIEGDPLNGIYYAVLAETIERRTKDSANEESARLRKLALEVDPENLTVIQIVSMAEARQKALGGLKDKEKDKPESRPGS